MNILGDLRFALRTLIAQPGFTSIMVLTLAIAIGGNAAMFGVVNGTLLTPLPYEAPERLVRIWETTPEGHNFSASEPNFLDFRERNRSFEQLAASKDVGLTLHGHGEPLRLDGLAVSHDFFATLGITPRLGRSFSADEDAPGGDTAVVVLGHPLWMQHFGADPDIVGRTIELDGRPHAVIGVMPAGFDWFGAALWVPLAADPASDRGDHWLQLIGRLQPGVSVEAAHADLASIAAEIGEAYPPLAGWSVRVSGMTDWLVGEPFQRTALLLMAAVALLLVMACANLASLLFARAARRQAELGVRAALGAGRARLARQLLVEILLLVGAGVLLGIALAHGLVQALQTFGTGAIPRLDEIAVDGRVLAFSIGLGLLTAVLFGLGPVLAASRVDPSRALANGGRGGVSRRRRRLNDGLVMLQVALALMLLVGAGLLFRSLLELRSADLGYAVDRLHAVELQLGDRHAEPWQKVVFFSALTERLQALPGVAAVGASSIHPFAGNNFMNTVTPVERAAEVGESGFMQARWRAVTPTFFEAAGLPLLRGRLFDRSDRWDGPRLVVISRTLAERMWPGEEAVGKTLYWGGIGGTPRIVAGVVGDYQDVEPGADMAPVMFLPYNQLPWPKMSLLLRGRPGHQLPLAAVRQTIRDMDPELPIPAIQPLRAQLAESVAGPRLRTLLLGAFALGALLLAAVGVYGVMASNAAQRRRELGLRIALGAKPAAIAGLLLSSGLRLALVGIALGLLGAWMLSHLLQSLLYATAPLDPLALVGSTGLLAAVVLLACSVPAWRAARMDPLPTLQAE